jgi:lipopolysaccharide export system protein LptA
MTGRGLARLGRAMACALCLVGAMSGIHASFAAQSLGIGAQSDKPIQVYADEGIEWNQNTHQYIARGNAKAIQGTTTVYGDTLVAYYEEIPGGNTEIYRLDAIGRVRIVSPTETAYGDKGVYDVRKGVLVLTGKALRFVTEEEVITARDSLEYYEEKSLAVARGDAVSRPAPSKRATAKTNRTVRADVLTAHFRDNDAAGGGAKKTKGKAPKGNTAASGGSGNSVDRMDAYGNVVVTRPGEVAFGDRGVYLPDTEMVHLWGKVRITREDNQINGNYAEVNFRSGISRILASPSDPVRALIEVEKEPEKGPPAR